MSGSGVLSLCPTVSSAGLKLHQGKGVDQYTSNPLEMSSECFNIFFTVCTVLSTWPLLCGYRGLLVICLKLYAFEKAANSCELYCGPLSLLTTSEIPCLENTFFSAAMVLTEVVDDVLITSGYREK